MYHPIHFFRALVWFGLFVNLAFAIPAFFAPQVLGYLIEVPEIKETVWLRNVGILLIILSSTYIPVIQDPVRYIMVTVIIVVGRFAAGGFFSLLYVYSDYPSGIAMIGGTDLVLSTLQAYFLVRLLQEGDPLAEANA